MYSLYTLEENIAAKFLLLTALGEERTKQSPKFCNIYWTLPILITNQYIRKDIYIFRNDKAAGFFFTVFYLKIMHIYNITNDHLTSIFETGIQ